jgi:RES domain-containing protein
MIVLWRLYRARYGPGLDGVGGTVADGRRHSRGSPVVYFGASAAIVVLERLPHTDPDLVPRDLRLARFAFSGRLSQYRVEKIAKLPSGWPRDQNATRAIGDKWLREGGSCLLVVPSAILPEESNLVFSPGHRHSRLPRMISERLFTLDARLI